MEFRSEATTAASSPTAKPGQGKATRSWARAPDILRLIQPVLGTELLGSRFQHTAPFLRGYADDPGVIPRAVDDLFLQREAVQAQSGLKRDSSCRRSGPLSSACAWCLRTETTCFVLGRCCQQTLLAMLCRPMLVTKSGSCAQRVTALAARTSSYHSEASRNMTRFVRRRIANSLGLGVLRRDLQ